jgi:hypothetical protein
MNRKGMPAHRLKARRGSGFGKCRIGPPAQPFKQPHTAPRKLVSLHRLERLAHIRSALWKIAEMAAQYSQTYRFNKEGINHEEYM